jgi:hypothetical protein
VPKRERLIREVRASGGAVDALAADRDFGKELGVVAQVEIESNS